MEVHAHSHTESPPAGRAGKKWTHYLWEFLMLFLAVFAGFLAENQREHMVEHQREKAYIRSLIRDVGNDTLNITRDVLQYQELKRCGDSVLAHFSEAKSFSSSWSNNYFKLLEGYPDFIYTDQTMQQLKNAGGLRLIRSTSAVDSIIDYDATVRDLELEETSINQFYNQLHAFTNNSLNYRRVVEKTGSTSTNAWIVGDEANMQRLFNLIYKYHENIMAFTFYLQSTKRTATKLILFLKKEYHIK